MSFLSILSSSSNPKIPKHRPGGSACQVKDGEAHRRRRDVLCSQRVFLSFLWILLAPQLRASEGCSVWSPRRWLRCDLQADVFLSFLCVFLRILVLFLNGFHSPAHTYWSLVSSNYCVMGSSDGLASVFSWLYSPEKPFMFLLSRRCMPSIIFSDLSPSGLGPSIVLDCNCVIM